MRDIIKVLTVIVQLHPCYIGMETMVMLIVFHLQVLKVQMKYWNYTIQTMAIVQLD